MLLETLAAFRRLKANLEYDDIDLSSISSAPGADSVSAFSLATTAESIELEDGTATGKLLLQAKAGLKGFILMAQME